MSTEADYQPTPRSTPTRYRERARYDRRTVHRILDEALICHLGYLSGGRPVVLPTTHARRGETLYLHGSTGGGPVLAARAAAAAGRDCRSASPSRWSTPWCWRAPRCTTR
ncbi:pyridoxamine 5'-phosphate oxidase family protein [Mycobacterium avium subsp. avium 2285 (R)]|nr:pyridoxamine 5'-phosphate oxidase family protein [Mycobacterium avium subsp. avium 2285 (R)]